MLVTYYIFFCISIFLILFHFPFADLILLCTAYIPLIDFFIQLKSKKANKVLRILSTLIVFLLSLYFSFKFFKWQYSLLFLWLAIFLFIFYIYWFYKTKAKYNFRYILTCLLFLFMIFNATLKNSYFRQLYLLEDLFNDDISSSMVQHIAYDYYLEGDYEKAEILIQKNITHLEELLENHVFIRDEKSKYIINLEQSKKDLENIKNRTWTNFTPLFNCDIFLYKKK